MNKSLARIAKSFIRFGSSNEVNRVEWVKKALTSLPQGARLLDAGAGEQPFKAHCSHLRYVSQDFAMYDGEGDRRGLQMGSWDASRADIVCDIAAIPEADGSFDAILCTEVLEHVPDPLAVLREFSRLLKAGGELILTAPFSSLTHFAPYYYSTGFSRYYYEYHLPRQGFEIVELSTNGSFFEYIAQELRRIPSVGRRYASSRAGLRGCLGLLLTFQMLGRLSACDTGSQDILTFGIHIKAEKV